MPRSKGRRPKPRQPDRQRARAAERPRPLRDRDLLVAAHLDESRMRFMSALEHLRQLSPGMRRQLPGWIQDLDDLVTLGELAQPWHYARWLGHAAFRWASMSQVDFRIGPLAWSLARGMYGESATHDDAVAQTLNPWVQDAWLFDHGAFDRYVRQVAPVGVVDMCPEVRNWSGQPVRLLRRVGGDEHIDRYVDQLGVGEFGIRPLPDAQPTHVGGLCVARPLPAPDGGHLRMVAGIECADVPPTAADLATASSWLGWLGRRLAAACDETAPSPAYIEVQRGVRGAHQHRDRRRADVGGGSGHRAAPVPARLHPGRGWTA